MDYESEIRPSKASNDTNRGKIRNALFCFLNLSILDEREDCRVRPFAIQPDIPGSVLENHRHPLAFGGEFQHRADRSQRQIFGDGHVAVPEGRVGNWPFIIAVITCGSFFNWEYGGSPVSKVYVTLQYQSSV